ncbi:MAG: LCP family protein [Dermatophilaceae bacterium]
MALGPSDEGTSSRASAVATRSALRAAKRRHRRRIGLGVLAALLVGLTVLTGAAYLKLNSNITRIDVSRVLGKRPSTSSVSAGSPSPLNILVMGSDTRQGIGTTEYGRDTVEGGAHSDTNLIVHLSADRSRALVVSIPRDSMTKAPKNCADPASTVANGEVRQWNYNFNAGGPGCVMKTVEGLTGIYLDHFIVVDFRGFQDMVDALGGVEVCTAKDIDDADSQFTLSAGRHRLDGKQALGYVRVRKTLGDGSDLNRIKRQQAFLSSIAQEATSSRLLLRPDRLFSFLNAATSSLTSDPGLSLTTMTSIARSVSNLGVKNIEFVTVPVEVYPADPNRVQWKASADDLWAAIRADRPLPGTGDVANSTPTSTATVDKPLTIRPDRITVTISNDSGVTGLALQAGDALRVQGFVVDGYRNGQAGAIKGTLVLYGTGQSEAARTVAAAFPGSVIKADPAVGRVIVVHLGIGAANPVEVPNRLGNAALPSMTVTATNSDDLQTRNAGQDICN